MGDAACPPFGRYVWTVAGRFLLVIPSHKTFFLCIELNRSWKKCNKITLLGTLDPNQSFIVILLLSRVWLNKMYTLDKVFSLLAYAKAGENISLEGAIWVVFFRCFRLQGTAGAWQVHWSEERQPRSYSRNDTRKKGRHCHEGIPKMKSQKIIVWFLNLLLAVGIFIDSPALLSYQAQPTS